MCVPSKPFQPSLMFVGKLPFLGALYGEAPTLPKNIRLGCKDSPGTNILAYYKSRAVKSFITLVPGVNVI
jgi:hypothetical protein